MTEPRRVSTKETATLMRARLKALYPGTKFSVRTSTYSMGSHVVVQWVDGPTRALVDLAVGDFCGKGFDGSIDGSYYWTSWLHAGRATLARTAGTVGSGGCVAAQANLAPHPRAELVEFGGSRVSTSRTTTAHLAARALASMVRKGAPAAGLDVVGDGDGAYIRASYAVLGTEQGRWEDAALQTLARFMIAG